MAKKITFIILRVSLGLFFIFSAYMKLFPIEYFEFQLVSDHLATWSITGYFARAIIAFEFFLGFAFVANVEWRRSVAMSALLMIAVFTVYLLVGLVMKGNEENCNCFGPDIKVSTGESLLKNVVLMVVLGLVWYFDRAFSFRYPKIILGTLLVASGLVVFIANPIDRLYIKNSSSNALYYPVDFNFLYDTTKYTKPSADLRKGKHVVAFMSLTCPHCRLAALKMGILKKNNPDLPFYNVLNGDSADLKTFFEETKSGNIESNIVLGEQFINLSGYNLPSIIMVNDGVVVKKIDYFQMTDDSLQVWLRK
jgi:thiol-disulfide isomerase/thioredoxin